MKRNILKGTVALAIVFIIACNLKFSGQKDGMSDLSLANIEALAGEVHVGGALCVQNQARVYSKEHCNMTGYYVRDGTNYTYTRDSQKGQWRTVKDGFEGTVTSDCAYDRVKTYKAAIVNCQ